MRRGWTASAKPPPPCRIGKRWEKLTAIGATFNQTTRQGKETVQMRLSILSENLTAERFAEAVRRHWSIENELHWQLE